MPWVPAPPAPRSRTFPSPTRSFWSRCRPPHPLARQEKIRLKDLRDTPFVLQGPRHSIRIIAEQLFRQAGFQPVVSFESNDVILLDSMMHQAVGVGLVSNAHVFPCDELAYRPLDPPVYQTLHLRFPLGHTLTEPERYLAGLLTAERIADLRYKPTDEPLVKELLQEIRSPSELADNGRLPREDMGTALQTMQEVNLDSKILEYLISIVEEQSLSRAAERHFLAQSALSRHLRSVEEMVETPLFTRQHNRLRPTSAGTIFVNNARNILRIEKEMFAHASAYRQGHGGNLYISCDPLFSQALREHVVPVFQARHPDIGLNIREENQEQTLESLMNSSTDLGIFLSSEPKHTLLHCEVLTLTEMVYCFAPGSCPEGWQPGCLFPERAAAAPPPAHGTGGFLPAGDPGFPAAPDVPGDAAHCLRCPDVPSAPAGQSGHRGRPAAPQPHGPLPSRTLRRTGPAPAAVSAAGPPCRPHPARRFGRADQSDPGDPFGRAGSPLRKGCPAVRPCPGFLRRIDPYFEPAPAKKFALRDGRSVLC